MRQPDGTAISWVYFAFSKRSGKEYSSLTRALSRKLPCSWMLLGAVGRREAYQ